MWGALEWSLDVATALSIIGAAIAFILQQREQKRADRRDAKWTLLRELTDKMAKFKTEIVHGVQSVHSHFVRDTESPEKINEKMNYLATVAYTSLGAAHYYAHYDLKMKAAAIVHYYDDQDLENIPEKIEAFLASMSDVIGRLKLSEAATNEVETSVSDYYENHFLRDIGFRLQGDPTDFEQPMGEDLDDIGKEYQRLGYTPRRYIRKEDQPPTAFEVLDDFCDSILGKR